MSSFRTLHNIIRQVPGEYVSGDWIEGMEITVPVQASVQPISQRDAVSVPEGKRAEDSIKLYTETEIFVSDAALKREADRINYRGHIYECIAVEPWQSGVISHYKAIFNKV